MWPALIAAGAQLAGGLIGQHGAQQTNAQQMEFNANQAQLNRNFQERMSDTQYQRATADMRAAGLNPMLAYQQGGAGTPGGATASTSLSNPSAPLARGVSDSVSSAIGAWQATNQAKLIDRQAANQSAQAYRNAIEGGLAAIETNIKGSDDIQDAMRKTIMANLDNLTAGAQELRSRRTSELASAEFTGTQSNVMGQQKMSPGFQKVVMPWINDAHGAMKMWREMTASLDPFAALF